MADYRDRREQAAPRARTTQRPSNAVGRSAARRVDTTSRRTGASTRTGATARTRSSSRANASASARTTARPSARSRPGSVARAQRPLPVRAIAIGVVAILAIALVAFGVRSCASSKSVDGQEAPIASAPLENDGTVVLTLLGDEDTIVLAGEDYIESGAQAIDRSRGQLTQDVKIEGDVDTSTPGTYQVTYSVENADGMRAERVRNVHVVESMDADQDGIPVMMYHWIYRDDQPPESEDTNFLSASKLEAQLQWLNEEGYYFPSHQEIRAYVDGTHSLPSKSVVLTFDDGEGGFLEYGVPLFDKYKIPATSYVIGDNPATPGAIRDHASEYVSYQSHSYGLHNDGSSGLGHGGIIFDKSHDEIVADAKTMVEMLGMSPSFAYPYGDVSDDAPAALAEAGVLCAYTVNYGNVHKGDDPMQLNRVRVFGESPLEGYIYQVETGE